MNQRNTTNRIFIPKEIVKNKKESEESTPEDLIFDEANKSEKIQEQKDQLKELNEEKELLNEKKRNLKKEEEIQKNKSSIKRIDELAAKVEKSMEEQTKK